MPDGTNWAAEYAKNIAEEQVTEDAVTVLEGDLVKDDHVAEYRTEYNHEEPATGQDHGDPTKAAAGRERHASWR